MIQSIQSPFKILLAIGLFFFLTSCAPASKVGSKENPADPAAASETLLVSAASSLTDAMKEIGTAFTQANPGVMVRFNFAASGPLEQQIEQGAPVDVFASASAREMDMLEKKNLLEAGTRCSFAGNRLVLIALRNSPINNWEDLKSSTVQKVAISNPDSVPSGRYARETLKHRQLWDSVQAKAVFGENVRQTLTYVADGNADAGIVFATDAEIEKTRVKIVAEAISGTDHKPIEYPAAVLRNAPRKETAKRFITFLQSAEGQSLLKKYSFSPAPASR